MGRCRLSSTARIRQAMWSSAAAQVRRLGWLTGCQMQTFLNGSHQPSYSVLMAVRAKVFQHSSICSQVISHRFLPIRCIHSENQTADSRDILAIKTASDMSLDNEGTGAADMPNSNPTFLTSDSGMYKCESPDAVQSSDNQPSVEAGRAIKPQSSSVQVAQSSTISQTPGRPLLDDGRLSDRPRSGSLPVRSHSLAPYVAASPDLRRLVSLGVDVSSWDRRPGVPQMVLKLDWERDMQPRVQLLHDAGVPADRLATFITRNPLIFKERLDDLQVRLNYLAAKRFSREQVASVICRDPLWLMFSTARIDRRLGLFVGMFDLKPQELRQLAAKCPGIITSNIQHIKDSVFTIKEEFGFERQELKEILLAKPKVLMLSRWALQDRLHYLHNEMGLSHQLIAGAANVLTYRSWRVRQRHLMLNMLKRDQYDRGRPGYVSLDRLVGTTDQEFCRDIAQVPVASYNEFLKTL